MCEIMVNQILFGFYQQYNIQRQWTPIHIIMFERLICV